MSDNVETPKLKKDWEGRYVRLTRRLTNHEGFFFELGETLKVEKNHGGLWLSRVGRCPLCARRRTVEIRDVSESNVLLLPEDTVVDVPMTLKNANEDLRLALAKQVHGQWAKWAKHLFDTAKKNDAGDVVIPQWAVERWRRQMTAEFDDLPSDEQISDYAIADTYLVVIKKTLGEF